MLASERKKISVTVKEKKVQKTGLLGSGKVFRRVTLYNVRLGQFH